MVLLRAEEIGGNEAISLLKEKQSEKVITEVIF